LIEGRTDEGATTMADATTCKHDAGWTWHLSPADEAGWRCAACSAPAPGDPPGYRPDLDRSEIDEKCRAILDHLVMADLVHVSNSTEGEGLIGSTARRCLVSGWLDQYSIVQALLALLNRTHAEYWRRIGDGVRDGADPRERCDEPGCGELATSFTAGGPKHCREHGTARMLASLTAEGPAPDVDPWEAFGTWEAKWREDHPDDDRDSLALIDIYAKEAR
jgi:hypothetical protein